MFKIDIFDFNRLVEVNKLARITNPISLNMDKSPTEDGLFSAKLFGKPGTIERKRNFGYIELYGKFLHPVFYKVLLQLDRNIERVIDGSRNFKITNTGDIVPNEDGEGHTGLKWLYDNWNKISFKDKRLASLESDDVSEMRKIRVNLTKLSKRDEVFINKVLVIPAFYRDINFQKISSGVIMKDEINNFYTKLMNYASGLESNRSSIDLINYSTEANLQNTINELYEYLEDKVAKKDGIIHNKFLSKAIDYSSRSVISATPYNGSNYKSGRASYTHAGIPIAHCCSNFYPFLVRELERVFTDSFPMWQVIPDIDPGFKQEFSINKIEKMIKRFIFDTHYRLSYLSVDSKKKGEKIYLTVNSLTTNKYDGKQTLLDIFFVIMSRIVADKHVYITRYPVDNYQNISPMRINILTTEHTYNDIYNNLPLFPKYNPEDKNVRFLDTIVMSMSYLASMGADFDGDTVSVRGVFTKEANEEADRIMKSKISLVDSAGGTVRTMKQDGVLALYMLTRR